MRDWRTCTAFVSPIQRVGKSSLRAAGSSTCTSQMADPRARSLVVFAAQTFPFGEPLKGRSAPICGELSRPMTAPAS